MRLGLVVLVLVCGSACRQDMHDQPSYSTFEASTFFGDRSSARTLPEGTVARGQLKDDELLYTGKVGGAPASELPFPVDEAVMTRGHEMFDAFCSHCHGRAGLGDGMVVQRGFTKPPSLLDDKLMKAPTGHFFDVITNGFGMMPDHAAQIAVRDRWAIAVYVRALQKSPSRLIDAVPPAARDPLTNVDAVRQPSR